MHAVSLENRCIGCLLGLAIGDALGSHFEGQPAAWIGQRYPTSESLIDNPPEAPWHYTDDTQMAIGVAEALLKDGQIVESSLCAAFVENYVPSRGYGRGARVVLGAMAEGHDYKHLTNELFPGGSFGNGAAMRVAPVGLMFHRNNATLWEQAQLSAQPTHVHPLGIEGAQLIAQAVAIALRDQPFERLQFFSELQQRSETPDFATKLKAAAAIVTPDGLTRLGNGIAAQDSVATAIGCFSVWPHSYEQVVANAILIGGDTDTIAAMAGAIAGAHLGVGAIPEHWLNRLEDDHKGRSYITDLARRIAEQ